jgi:tryptophan 2,3-dioxygenase
MPSDSSPYETYLRLDELLTLQRPLTPPSDTQLWVAEHFFIVLHQSSELLLRQALLDLGSISHHLGSHSPDSVAQAEVCLRRTEALIALLHHHLDLFDHLAPHTFAAFRPGLDGASGAQSVQFDHLFSLTGTGPGANGGSGSLAEEQALLDSPRLSGALHAVQKAVHAWQERHVTVVRAMIGDQRGTGGTNGAPYLASRVTAPRPDAHLDRH